MSRIYSTQSLHVNWVGELYEVSKRTMHMDARRSCWICKKPFKIGDGMTVAGTDEGNKTMHSRCYAEQAE